VHWTSPFFIRKRNLDTERKDKKNDINREDIFRKPAGYTLLDHKRNEEILKDLKVEPVAKKLSRNK